MLLLVIPNNGFEKFPGSSEYINRGKNMFGAIGTVLRDTRYGDSERRTLTSGINYLFEYWISGAGMKILLGRGSMFNVKKMFQGD